MKIKCILLCGDINTSNSNVHIQVSNSSAHKHVCVVLQRTPSIYLRDFQIKVVWHESDLYKFAAADYAMLLSAPAAKHNRTTRSPPYKRIR